METAQKAKKKLEASEEAESQKAGRKRRVTQQQQQYHFDDDECYDCDDEQDDYLEVAATTRGADEPSTLYSPLFGFANVAATTPLLSEDCRRLCKASKNNRLILRTNFPSRAGLSRKCRRCRARCAFGVNAKIAKYFLNLETD